ncbi:hypothetical protein OHA72_35065 [Dactylosporangium sp. NBC_01737]|uniref:hypothetical protein n=1 Tax=Dactylosporangium sp. NBC_01737 TaxID=2975959 RepID=UPI002E13FEC3|nr:hypothetical protein OHA72_35065 [Dactylosporangium sp. NBC_01737]
MPVPAAFSAGERARAEALAGDARIRVALDTPDAGFTQVLAAGPYLERWWTHAPDPYARALITAALDARRAGMSTPLPRALLAAAVPGYLTATERATAPRDWLDRALAYATTPLHGATSALRPTGPMGTVTGYLVADYLHQQAGRARRDTPLPDTAWQAIVEHHHPYDSQRLAGEAHRWRRYRYAEALYRRAADDGDIYAGGRLGELLVAQDRIGELRARDAAGDLGARGELDRLLVREGNLEELRARTDAGHPGAARLLVAALVDHGRLDEALAILRQWADAGDDAAARHISKLLARHARVEDLRALADSGHLPAAVAVVHLLAGQGLTGEALSYLRARPELVNHDAAHGLAGTFARHGGVDGLRALADLGDTRAAYRLVGELIRDGRVDEVRALADAGDTDAARTLVHLFVAEGRVDDLRLLADAGNGYAAHGLAGLGGQP